jgi:UDP-N-acetyl-D-glucosamine dehydrogenase
MPSLDVVERLAARGAVIGVVDPHVPADRLARHGFEVVDADSDLSSWTMAVLLTDHEDFNYAQIAQDLDVVFDTRGVYRRVGVASDNVVTL